MKVLMLCGFFSEEHIEDVIEHSKGPVEFSANNFQEKLIYGLEENNIDFHILTAPFIGSYPNACNLKFFKGFKNTERCTYVEFNNIWGIRNISRAIELKKALNDFINDRDKEKIIIVYSAHTPFIKAAKYAKKRDPNIKICLYVPDLPEYMNLTTNKNVLYRIAKKYDIKAMHNSMMAVDLFVLLTDQMKNRLPLYNKPYMVVEGILDCIQYRSNKYSGNTEKYIVYTGKLDSRFGILDLLKAFSAIKNKAYKLILCGIGDCYDEAIKYAENDVRISVLGQVSPQVAKSWQMKADVLVNPRRNDDEYTKYSFPSKNIEYLMTGKPVVSYKLDGMPKCYSDFIFEIEKNTESDMAIKEALEFAINASVTAQKAKYDAFCEYAIKKLEAKRIIESIISELK